MINPKHFNLPNWRSRCTFAGASTSLKLNWILGVVAALVIFSVAKTEAATIAYWRFDDPSNLGLDSSGNGNDLTVVNLTPSSDVAPNAPGTNSVIFDGSSSFAQTINPLALSSYPSITIEWLSKFTSTSAAMVFVNQTFANGGIVIDHDENGAESGLMAAKQNTGGGGPYTTRYTQYPTDGRWHHWAVTMDESGAQAVFNFYIDGHPAATVGAAVTAHAFIDDPLIFGHGFGAYWFNGSLDEVRISSGILTPDQFLVPPSTNISIVITQSPRNTTAVVGNMATFSVSALLTNSSGASQSQEPLRFQWQKNGADILNATNSSYTTPAAALADSGSHFAAVVSAASVGGVAPLTTTPATLIVTTNTNGISTVAYWRFEDPANLGLDSSGNGNDLNVTDLAVSTDIAGGASGTNSVVFNGSSSFAQTVANLDLSVYNGVTVEWFSKFTSSAAAMMFVNQDFANGGFVIDHDESAGESGLMAVKQNLGAGGPYTIQYTHYPTDGTWHHWAVTMDESGSQAVFKFYIDGQLAATAGGGASVVHALINDPLLIGHGFGAYWYNGSMDEVRISGGVLPPSQFLLGPVTNIVLTTQPVSVTVLSTNNPPVFTVGAVLTNNAATPQNQSLLRYQWQKNGTDIPGATNSSYTLPTVDITNSGDHYAVVVSAPDVGGVVPITSASAVLTFSTVIAYWRFDDPANLGADSSSNGNDLTTVNLTTSNDIAPNAPGTNSVVFDGSSSFAQTINNLNLSSYSSITIEWFSKFTSNVPAMVFVNQTFANGGIVIDHDENGGESGLMAAKQNTGSGGPYTTRFTHYPTDGQWHHWAVTMDESGAQAVFNFYIDGHPVNTTGGAVAAHAFIDDPLIFGHGFGAFWFNGSLDDVRISSGILPTSAFLGVASPLQLIAQGNNMTISWPDNGLQYTLQQANSLNGPWTSVAGSPTLSGGNFQITVPKSTQTTFFRLIH
jgi:concanavalin A-like lectin/glucanase superfamily protein